MAKVSIIVPVYNVEKYLHECLESLVSQALQDIEIICINDGSTDSSGEILDAYAARDSRFKVIHKPNSGYGHSCNLGLDTATADYIGIIESDDFADKNMFSDLYALITENNCDVAKSDWWEYWGKGKKVFKSEQLISMLKPGKISNVEEKKKLSKCPPAVWSSLYNKNFLNKNNIRFLETPGASFQDISFTFKVVVLAKDIYITNNAYVYYRHDNLNSSARRKDGGEFILKEYAEIDRLLNERPELKKVYKGCKFYKQYDNYIWNLKRLAPEYKKEIFGKFVKEFQTYYENRELDESAFEYLNKSKIMMLINDQRKAWKKFQFLFIRTALKEFMRNFFLVRINHERVYIRVFGNFSFRVERRPKKNIK
ncbi:MAG: glycosyltransferase [Spirochaetaceae bacterium]|nr:glycosyltransferase [Spirochaetaceae bacterium]